MNQKTTLKKLAISMTILVAVFVFASCSKQQPIPQDNRQSDSQDSQQNIDQNNQNDNQQQTENVDTSNWLSFTDEKYGFEIKYPENWQISDGGINAFGGEWLKVNSGDKYIPIQINRRELTDSNPSEWTWNNVIKNSIGGGQKMELEEYLTDNPYVYAMYVRLDNSEMYVRHKHLVSDKKTMVYFSFEEIDRRRNQTTMEIEETSFSEYMPEFEAMVHSIKFMD
ncbi:MAG: hypothetical protein U9P90_04825 [Patescibacteria group bacterium]|nr:hypothetical protein [Patescibacteria group bacterium]